MNKEDLIKFEEEIADIFNQGLIRAPIHLYNGNEDNIIRIFENIRKDDWVLCSWRSHYQCLLKGVPPERLKEDIIAGRSISLSYKDYKIISSGIVGGNIPIALGIALDIKLKGGSEWVYCFIGDMTEKTGIYHECHDYAVNFGLPITFIIEDNGKSVCTPTEDAWGTNMKNAISKLSVSRYVYDGSKYPHAGSGRRIQF